LFFFNFCPSLYSFWLCEHSRYQGFSKGWQKAPRLDLKHRKNSSLDWVWMAIIVAGWYLESQFTHMTTERNRAWRQKSSTQCSCDLNHQISNILIHYLIVFSLETRNQICPKFFC
jgi:hypothetical protein